MMIRTTITAAESTTAKAKTAAGRWCVGSTRMSGVRQSGQNSSDFSIHSPHLGQRRAGILKD